MLVNRPVQDQAHVTQLAFLVEFLHFGKGTAVHSARTDDIDRQVGHPVDDHRIGNHTFNHIRGFEYSNPDYLANAQKVDEIIHSDLFRPPHGHMGFRQYYTLRYHYRIIMWDLVTRDYSKRMRPEQVLNNVKRYARNGSIITFHDSLKSWNNGNLQYALPRSIEFLKAEGYEFKVL